MSETSATSPHEGIGGSTGNGWQRTPLYVRILIAMVIGTIIGLILHNQGYIKSPEQATNIKLPATLILRLLQALATPLVLFAILNAFATTEIKGREGGRLFVILITNTIAAIVIGMLITSIVQPGRYFTSLREMIGQTTSTIKQPTQEEIVNKFLPRSILQPLVENEILQLLWIALAFGIAFRQFKNRQVAEGKEDYLLIEKPIGIILGLLMTILMWVIALIPFAVLSVVIAVVGQQGINALQSLLGFILVVVAALVCQLLFYMVRIALQARRSPFAVISGVSDALVTAFSTASSTVTMPITFRALLDKVGLRPKSASMGALVGANFNNDGTALYEAVAALFMAQALGMNLDIGQQLLVVLTSILASVGAAGIPEAGLVTMTLVFRSVGLPISAIALLISVDWFLDRCRTAINVMGDVTTATILDAQERREEGSATAAAPPLAASPPGPLS